MYETLKKIYTLVKSLQTNYNEEELTTLLSTLVEIEQDLLTMFE